MKQVMSSILLLFLFNLVLTASTARSEGNCPVVPGLPGREGRDGAPGRDGPPGPPGTFSYSEFIAITKELQEQKQTIDVDSLTEELRKRGDDLTCSQDLGRNRSTPAMSCLHIYQCEQSPPSGPYWIVGRDGNETTSVRVYCDMDNWHSSSKGWTRVAYINMTEDGAQCPISLRTIPSPNKLCGRLNNAGGCSSIVFPTEGMRYSKICGQAVMYQYISMDAFAGPRDINSYYVDGMSITYGSPRKHIWTYVVGLSDDYNYNGRSNCPCAKYPGPTPPSFVGDHYYCESGNTGVYEYTHTPYINGPLWDGEGCGDGNNCCAQPGMPWFCRTLPQEVEGDIEMRLCATDAYSNNEDLYLELLEMYIQ